ncbi:hypothetical protein ACVILK_005345 [Bradyrhizobium embrapense]
MVSGKRATKDRSKIVRQKTSAWAAVVHFCKHVVSEAGDRADCKSKKKRHNISLTKMGAHSTCGKGSGAYYQSDVIFPFAAVTIVRQPFHT